MTDLLKYRIWCSTDSKYEYVWNVPDYPPTLCPTNSAHTVDLDSVTIVETIASNTVTIREEATPTANGKYQAKNLKLVVDASSTNHLVYEFDLPVNLLSAFFITGEEHEGGVFDVVVAENTTVGVLMASATIGDNVFTVSSTVISNAITGNRVRLTDGVHADTVGIITDINRTTNRITTTAYTTHAFAAYGTYFQIGAPFADQLEIAKPNKYAYAEKKIGGAYIPAHLPCTVRYTNPKPYPVTIIVYLEFLY